MDVLDTPRKTWLRPLFGGIAAIAVVLACCYMAQIKASRDHFEPKPPSMEISRVAVETATDSDISKVADRPIATTLTAVKTMPRDVRTMVYLADYADRRSPPFETHVWKLRAMVVKASLRADHDLYLVIEDQGYRTSAELPDPQRCVGSPFEERIKKLRARLDLEIKPSQAGVKVGRMAELTGIGFFGTSGGGNGARLMPLLDLKWVDEESGLPLRKPSAGH